MKSKLSLMSIVKEIEVKKHFNDRFYQRILNRTPFDVILTKYDYPGPHMEIIGTYQIPDNDFHQLINDYKFLKDVTSKSSASLNFGVKMYFFNLKDNMDNINLFDEYSLDDIKDKVINQNYNLWVEDPETKSRGFLLVSVIRDNILVTTMLTRAHSDEKLEQKISKDNEIIVIVDKPQDIAQYFKYSSKI